MPSFACFGLVPLGYGEKKSDESFGFIANACLAGLKYKDIKRFLGKEKLMLVSKT
jgi:hypothetical protein